MSRDDAHSAGMPIQPALEHLAATRGACDIIVTNQASARLWPRLSTHPLDFNYNPSNMGGAIPLALGLALSQPDRHVISLSGDGSLLMNLGCLVTVIASGAKNLSILLLDNGIYEVTGGQQTPGAAAAADYAGLARASGFLSVAEFNALDAWRSECSRFLAEPGPRFARLVVGPTPSEVFGDTLPPIAGRIADLQRRL